jgi:ribonuclease III
MKLPRAILDRLRLLLPWRKATRRLSGANIDNLERLLGYRFRDPSLLNQALTHKSSILPDNPASSGNWLVCNERLEFLGDAILNCLVTEHLYRMYPDKDEGYLSKIKSLLVSRKILGDLAVALGLGQFLILGFSETKGGGPTRISVQSNAFEALIGALYLDGGMASAHALLKRSLFPRINEFLTDEDNANYKSALLEMAQRDGFGIPHYAVLSTSGPDHAKEFHVRVDVAGLPLGEGVGPNKKIAQQRAAYQATTDYNAETIRSHTRRSEGL